MKMSPPGWARGSETQAAAAGHPAVPVSGPPGRTPTLRGSCQAGSFQCTAGQHPPAPGGTEPTRSPPLLSTAPVGRAEVLREAKCQQPVSQAAPGAGEAA